MKTPQARRAAAILASVVVFATLGPQAIASAKTHPNRWRDTTPPSASISAPTSGATLTGAVSVTGTASDNASLAAVQVSVDGGAFQMATGTTNWNYGLDTTALSNASHTITARATDCAGNTSSTSESVTVSNPVPDTTNPTVSVASPTSGATVSGSISVTGTASDNVSVAQVQVSVDGGAFQTATGTTSWSYGLDTTTLSNASHTITAKATDGSGNTSTASVTVTVSNSSGSHMVTPEGVTIDVAPDVTGWTAQQIYDLLKPNAYQLSLIGPDLTIKVQTQYASSTSTSASSSGGVYTSFRATIYLKATSGQVFTAKPDYVVAHEYGHAWTMYHYYLTQQKDWNPWLVERGLLGDPRLDTTYNWSKTEMIADDYRMLFGTQTAQNQAAYINPDIADPRTVPGLKDWFMTVWAGGT